jgi:hypothetical protein
MTEGGVGGLLSLGYEHTSRHVVIRSSGSIAVGEGGVAPMLGIAVGGRR